MEGGGGVKRMEIRGVVDWIECVYSYVDFGLDPWREWHSRKEPPQFEPRAAKPTSPCRCERVRMLGFDKRM